ncbi:unnamed protein product [Diatraea saccharalis]|uniref:Lipase n=1 Tax=Diatraea saccharalis TaxID=40085 RepID=A0A9N9RB17_9NEOP|nr:unnamed protein product [Diatraea saccharalis]
MPVVNMTPKGTLTSNILVVISIAAVFYAITFPIKNVTRKKPGNQENIVFNFTQMTTQNGYTSEEHTVVTEDGYILRIFRVQGGRKCDGKRRSLPVLLMHGLLLSSDVWLDAGTDNGLAYLIANACFDLWVGNCRGNYYSRRHETLDPDTDAKFWHFSVDEIGHYDVPAMVDYVLDYTGAEKLNYVGYSQGASTFFIMCSERPEYCNKINKMISLAPASRQFNTALNPYRLLLRLFALGHQYLRAMGVEEVLSNGAFLQEFLAYACEAYWTSSICNYGTSVLIDSYHPGSVTNETTKIMFKHFPAGTSLQNMVRYGQSAISPDFQKYDYGKDINIDVYGQETPPKFNLSAVTTPVVILYGKNDALVSVKDVKWLVSKLPNVIDLVEVKDPLWNHLDVAYSQYIGEMLFPKIFEHLVTNSIN